MTYVTVILIYLWVSDAAFKTVAFRLVWSAVNIEFSRSILHPLRRGLFISCNVLRLQLLQATIKLSFKLLQQLESFFIDMSSIGATCICEPKLICKVAKLNHKHSFFFSDPDHFNLSKIS